MLFFEREAHLNSSPSAADSASIASSLRGGLLILALGLATALAGCGDDGATPTDAGTEDAAIELDGAMDAGSLDAAVMMDAAVDAGAPSCAEYSLQIAGTEETDALAASPARCGMAGYEWLRGETATAMGVGTVTTMDRAERVPAILLEALAQEYAAGLTDLPLGERDVTYRVVRYLTQDRGATIEASAIVAAPEDSAGEELDVILLLHGTTGFTDACNASSDDGYVTLSALLASLGYLVVAPDYIGLKNGGEPTGFLHPYLTGQPTAIASIDAIRAALRMAPDERGGGCVSNRVATFGASQGGHAALWVQRLLPYYGREFEHTGVVATVPPAAVYEEAERALSEMVQATESLVGSLTTQAEWYGYADRLDEALVEPWATDVPAAFRAGCRFGDVLGSLPETLDGLFTAELLAAAQGGTLGELQPWGCIVSESDLFRTTVGQIDASVPLLFVTGEDDPLVHTPIERVAYMRLCSELGIQAEYIECQGADHGEGTFFALPEILDYLTDRLAGEPLGETCAAPTTVRCRATQD